MAYTTIDDPSAYFQTALYTGTGSGQSITNSGNSDLQPDWVWVKDRSATNDHKLTDSSRIGGGSGPTVTLESNTANAEYDDQGEGTDATTSFNSDGFTIGTNGNYNTDDNTYVAWQWKANGGSLTTNDASATGVGGVDSVYQVNTTSKFGIMTYTATGSGNITVAHGLGSAPKLLITKVRDQAFNWFVWHQGLAATHGLTLNSTDASSDNADALGDTAPSSTIFTMGSGGTANNNYQAGDDIIAYYFDEVQGFSKFGSYEGNGNANGPFVYIGFKPAFLLYKNADDGARNWNINDTKRSRFNPVNNYLLPNLNIVEGTSDAVDFLSNGFKLRSTDAGSNDTDETIIYMAFAEEPFVTSDDGGSIPCTAR